MSSYEDVYGMAMSVFEALQNIQWKGPRQWELESIIDPISEQLLLKLSKSQNLVANPTLAAPTNIRYFLNNIQTSIDDPTQLIMFISFLIAVPLFSTFFVAMLTNVNIALKVLGLPLARNPVKASPLAVIFLMVTVFGNIPLVNFFPERATHVQALLPVQPGHYHGVIARVLQIVAFYEQFELAARVLLEIVSLVRYRRLQVIRLLRPASITAWLLTFAGFALRMWFTRVSTDTATSLVQSGSTLWVWGKVILRTDISYQSPDEFNDDVFIWIAYFVTTFCVSSLFVQYVLTPRHEDYQPVEPTIIKVTGSSSILTASAGCQTIVSGDDWVTKSSVALDARKIDRIQAVIDSDMNRTAFFARNWCNETEDASEDLKELTLLWQNDHTALQTHVSLLRGMRMIVEHHREDAQKQRQYADNVSASVRRLEETINQREKNYDEKLKLREKEYQDRIDALLVKVTALEKGTDVPDAALDDTNEKQASLPDANLGPRETESHPVLANTPDLQKTPETPATVECAPKSDTKSSSDPLLPSPPLSPPNADDSSSSGSSNGDKNQQSSGPRPAIDTINVPVVKKVNTSPTDLTCSDSSSVRLADAVSSTTEGGVEPEKASDSEMDAANASGSDDEIMEEIGTGIWSRVQKFQFRSEPFAVHQSIVRQHFTVQEIQKIIAMLTDFKANVANDTQREQVSIILNAGFPYRMDIKFASDLDYLSVFLDLAELHKKPTRERIFTQIPPMAFSCACGVHPQRICIMNGRGRIWRTYPLKAYVEGRLDKAVGDEKAYIQRNSARLLNNLDRLLGGRPEHWDKAVPVEVLKTNQTWDMNLIARRLLENLGLLEFREITTEGTSTEEYTPPALVEPASITPTTDETPSTETPSAAVPTTVPVNDSPSIEIPPTEPPITVPASSDTLSIEVPTADVPTTVPTCGETPSFEAPSEEVPTTTTTYRETPAIEVPPAEISTMSTFSEATPIKVPSVEPPVTMPSVNAPFSELSASLRTCNDPSPAQPLAIVSSDEPAQLQTASTEESLPSPLEATPAPSHSPVAPCVESPSQISPSTVSQAQPPLTSSSSSTTPTRSTPFRFTAPDWRQEALQDSALQQQTPRPAMSGSQRNGRKSRGGKGRPRHSNA